jgi:hypothetical protein
VLGDKGLCIILQKVSGTDTQLACETLLWRIQAIAQVAHEADKIKKLIFFHNLSHMATDKKLTVGLVLNIDLYLSGYELI